MRKVIVWCYVGKHRLPQCIPRIRSNFPWKKYQKTTLWYLEARRIPLNTNTFETRKNMRKGASKKKKTMYIAFESDQFIIFSSEKLVVLCNIREDFFLMEGSVKNIIELTHSFFQNIFNLPPRMNAWKFFKVIMECFLVSIYNIILPFLKLEQSELWREFFGMENLKIPRVFYRL
jgi:hypothetical protein